MIGDILQPTHLLFILVIALLVLGPKRLPEAGRALGRGLRDFKEAISGEDHDRDQVITPAAAAAQPAPPAAPAQTAPAAVVTAAPTATADAVHEPVEPAGA